MSDIIVSPTSRAIQYIRMSTEHQRYSLDNQKKVIAEYAGRHGYEIVETYADVGRSGLTLQERRELRRLLRDVADPNRSFSTILVLDVSRWGRFQDTDQHAAYEFICRDMGVRVEYVAEGFANDGSFASSMLKHMKRIMAAEYSRDLSAKVSWGQLQSAARGNKQGGSLTLGLRRLLIDYRGKPKWHLSDGEHKANADDRVVIVAGPKAELDVVRKIFKMFRSGTSVSDISRSLNFTRTPATHQSPWSFQKVKSILTNHLYTGLYVFNRTSQKLRTRVIHNPESMWVKVRLWDGIITEAHFAEVQTLLKTKKRGVSCQYTKAKLLDGLRQLWKESGKLSANLISYCQYLPRSSTYVKRFGSLQAAYDEIGYKNEVTPKAKVVRPKRGRAYTKVELLSQLSRALRENGHLSCGILQRAAYAASPRVYAKAFGSLVKAYEAVGFNARKLDPTSRTKCDETDALQKLARLQEKHGFIDTSLVANDRTMPSAVWYRLKYGSFANACAAAGINYDYGVNIARGKYRTLATFRDWPAGYNAPIHGAPSISSDNDLFRRLRKLFEDNGYITRTIIENDPEMPSLYAIFKRYACLRDLYAAAGLPKEMDIARFNEKRRRKAHARHPE